MTQVPLPRLGKYRLLEVLAGDGPDEVYKAEEEGPAGGSKTVMVKRVPPHLAFPVALAAGVVAQALQGLHYAHERCDEAAGRRLTRLGLSRDYPVTVPANGEVTLKVEPRE